MPQYTTDDAAKIRQRIIANGRFLFYDQVNRSMDNLDIIVVHRVRQRTRGKKVLRFAAYVAALCLLPDPEQQLRPEILLKSRRPESEDDALEGLAELEDRLLDEWSHDIFGPVDALKIERPWINEPRLRDRHW